VLTLRDTSPDPVITWTRQVFRHTPDPCIIPPRPQPGGISHHTGRWSGPTNIQRQDSASGVMDSAEYSWTPTGPDDDIRVWVSISFENSIPRLMVERFSQTGLYRSYRRSEKT